MNNTILTAVEEGRVTKARQTRGGQQFYWVYPSAVSAQDACKRYIEEEVVVAIPSRDLRYMSMLDAAADEDGDASIDRLFTRNNFHEYTVYGLPPEGDHD